VEPRLDDSYGVIEKWRFNLPRTDNRSDLPVAAILNSYIGQDQISEAVYDRVRVRPSYLHVLSDIEAIVFEI
jgi:hypothetical protein